jgi:CBS domain-containing protein
MLMKDFITKEFPVLKNSDTAEYALSVMDDLKIRHLPVVVDETYQCLLSEKDLQSVTDPSVAVNDLALFAPSINESGHLHEIMARMVRNHLTILPVVSRGGKYKGVVTLDKAFESIAGLCNAEAAGSIIALELPPRDYALSDIARIMEANNAHVLNLLSNTDEDTGRLILTIKIDLEDATPVIRSFERFNYTVLYHSMERGMASDVLLHRIDELFYYMNM